MGQLAVATVRGAVARGRGPDTRQACHPSRGVGDLVGGGTFRAAGMEASRCRLGPRGDRSERGMAGLVSSGEADRSWTVLSGLPEGEGGGLR